MALPDRLQSAVDAALAKEIRAVSRGRVATVRGVCVEVDGLRAAVGDLCEVGTTTGPRPAEVVGFQSGRAVVMLLDDLVGVAPFDPVTNLGRPLLVPTGPALLGRVIDALGRPLDGGPVIRGGEMPVLGPAPAAMARAPVNEPIETGYSAIDGLLTLARGQRVGIFSGSGVGKSTLLGGIARSCKADVNVLALIGERGREVQEFIRDVLGADGMQRSVVVVATSDSAPMLRFKGAFTAVTIAEAFRRQGLHVMFTMDSVTRFAGASREIGLAAGEPPTLRGYPPSLFANLPALVERLGNDAHGSITGLLTVLVDGDDMNEPVADALRGYLDGHIVLSRKIAGRGRYPAIDVLASVSRSMSRVTTPAHRAVASRIKELIGHYEDNRELLQVGAYRKGSDPILDQAIDKIADIERLIHQGEESRSIEDTLLTMQHLALDSTNARVMADT